MQKPSSRSPGAPELGPPATGPGSRGGEPGLAFGGFRLQPDGTLLRGDAVVHLPPRELAALRFLVAHAGQIVSPLQLRQALWGNVHVTADSVPKCLSSLRARLEPEKCIQTVYKRGYRFSAEVTRHGAETVSALPRLAILPFAAAFTLPEHLGPIIAEETITLLTNEPHPVVSVLARDSVFTLASRGLTAHQIGEMLKADLVLTGTLRELPSQFRLRAEMIRVEDGAQLWVEDLLVPQSQIAGLESELVKRLVFRLSTGVPGDGSLSQWWSTGVPGDAQMEPTLSQRWNTEDLSISAAAAPALDSESAPRHRRPQRQVFVAGVEHRGPQRQNLVAGAENLEAYKIFQRAHYEWQTMQRHRMQDSLQHLLRAIELDPSLMAARVDLVNLCVTQAFYGYMPPAVAASQVRRAAESGSPATGLGRWGDESGSSATPHLPLSPEALLPGLGWVSFHVDHDLPAALQAFSLSAHLPHDPWTTRLRVMFALSRHRFAEAIEMLRAVIQLDPFSPWLHARLAWALHLAGQAAESVECIRHALSLFPDNEGAHLYGSMILAFNGEAARGTGLAQDLAQRLPHFDLATAVQAYALAREGRADEARAILERLQWLSRERFVLNSFTPAVYVALGDLDAALAELRASAGARCPWFFQMLADPRLKPLHARPEFQEMRAVLTRMEAAAAEIPTPEN
ncbi:MAG: winged helix-turn-helix domain-containing tetratricopeptide repeat protein [Terracidiphilus sp.]